MKIIFSLLALLLLNKVFSQDIEKIKQADTIYIYFKEDKIKQIHHIEKGKTKTYDNYFFDYSNRQVSFQFCNLQTLYSKIVKKKSFLKKNKDLILNYDFIEKMGNLYIAEMIGYGYRSKKVVYVVENNEIKCSKITLKQVTIVGPLRINEE